MHTPEYRKKLIEAAQQMRDHHRIITSKATPVGKHFYYDTSCCAYKLMDKVYEKISTPDHKEIFNELLFASVLLKESGIQMDWRDCLDGFQVDLGLTFDFDCRIAEDIAGCIDELCAGRSTNSRRVLARLESFLVSDEALQWYLNAPEEDRETPIELVNTVVH